MYFFLSAACSIARVEDCDYYVDCRAGAESSGQSGHVRACITTTAKPQSQASCLNMKSSLKPLTLCPSLSCSLRLHCLCLAVREPAGKLYVALRVVRRSCKNSERHWGLQRLLSLRQFWREACIACKLHTLNPLVPRETLNFICNS